MNNSSDGLNPNSSITPINDASSTLPRSYASALNQQQCPKRDQAIIFNAVEGSKLLDYILALGPLVGPKNIIFSSRISNSRICIYLSNKNVVDKFISELKPIVINNETLYGRRLITPSTRLVLSNVCPTIPNNIVQEELQNLGLKLLSSISHIRINIPNPDYSHILSFRRQVFIASTEEIHVPESILITYEDTQYRIFLSTDSQCFKCKQPGHIASQCSLPENMSSENSNVLSTNLQPFQHSTPLREATFNLLEKTSDTSTLSVIATIEQESKQQAGKRNHKDILTPPADSTKSQNEDQNLFVKPNHTKKKLNMEISTNLIIPLKPLLSQLGLLLNPIHRHLY